MPRRSAGVLLHRRRSTGEVEVLLVHPGGPFWARKDDGVWSIPKGEYDAEEDPRDAAYREFAEELGAPVPAGGLEHFLGEHRQPGGKLVSCWAVAGDFDVRRLRSNTFEMEWPPRSGRAQEFPEVDRAEWFPLDAARAKILTGQRPLLDELGSVLGPTAP